MRLTLRGPGTAPQGPLSSCFHGRSRLLDALLLGMAPAEPASACAHEDAGGGEQGEEAAAVLPELLADRLAEAEAALHDEEGMLRPTADTRLSGLDGLVPLGLYGAIPATDAEGHPGLLLVSRYLGALFGARAAESPYTTSSSSRISSPVLVTSLTLAAVFTTVWTRPLPASTPMWLFMPKYHWLPFRVWCISESLSFFLFPWEHEASNLGCDGQEADKFFDT